MINAQWEVQKKDATWKPNYLYLYSLKPTSTWLYYPTISINVPFPFRKLLSKKLQISWSFQKHPERPISSSKKAPNDILYPETLNLTNVNSHHKFLTLLCPLILNYYVMILTISNQDCDSSHWKIHFELDFKIL